MTYRIKLWKWERGYCYCEDREIYLDYSPLDGQNYLAGAHAIPMETFGMKIAKAFMNTLRSLL